MAAKREAATKSGEVRAADVLDFIRVRKSALKEEFDKVDAELARIKNRYEQLKKKIGELRGQEAYWAVETGEEVAPNDPPSVEPIVPDYPSQIPVLSGRRVAYVGTARTVLQSEGRPLRTKQGEAAPTDAPSFGQSVPEHPSHIQLLPGRRVAYADVARKVLESEGRPLRTKQIAQIMARQQYLHADEADWPTGAIYSSMSRRKKEFLRTKDGHWGLVGRDEDQD